MKKYVLFIALAMLISTSKSMAQGIDSLNINETFITLGESWYTDYFTGYAVYTDRSFFKDENGGFHVVFISNYKLYYCYSEDGTDWTTEQISNDHDGDFREAVMYADAEGNPYIATTVNPYYNYGNPTGINYGDEFRYSVYYFYKDGGIWIEEEVYNSTTDPGFSGNYGCKVNELYKNQNGDMVLIGHRYGWYSYGGELWEFTRNGEGNWSDLEIIHSYNDTPIDHSTEAGRIHLKDNGDRDLIYSRPYNASGVAELVYMSNTANVWSEPTVLTTDMINYRSWDLSVSPEGDLFLIHYSNDPVPHIKLFTDLNESTELPIDLSMVDQLQHAKIHVTKDGVLDLLVYPADTEQPAILYASEDFGDTWSAPISVERTSFPGVLPVTDQLSNQGVDLEFIRVTRVSTVEPFGPDSLFYDHIEQINTSTLATRDYEDLSRRLSLFPNPVTDEITVSYTLEQKSALNIRVYTLKGKVVREEIYSGSVGENQIRMNLNDLNSGTYIIEVTEMQRSNSRPGSPAATKKLIKH